MGKADEARAEFEKALKTIEESDLSAEIKENNRRFTHYNLARVAAAKKDFATAKSEAAEFRKKAEATNNPNQVKLANEVDGVIALAEKDWDKSIASLQQANLQNPQNLYRICQAYQGKGDTGKVAEFCGKAADFHSLPNLPYAFVRTKAKAEAAKKS
jgi:tetratricopeptide (TPR) repeat protein